jgi:hypothetical protein
VLLAGILWCRIALGSLARLGQQNHLVHVFLTLDYVFVCAVNCCYLLVHVVLRLSIVEK